MILPIYAYGQPVLKKVAEDIDKDYPKLDLLIENMWETMYNANGIGIAAPQIGKSIRLFLIDTEQLEENTESPGIKSAFINARIIEISGEEKSYEEGCLSIPHIRGDVKRQSVVTIKYLNSDFEEKEQTFTGIDARVILHEYDHLEGKLFTEMLLPLKKRLIKRKLEAIKKGKVDIDYRMRFNSK